MRELNECARLIGLGFEALEDLDEQITLGDLPSATDSIKSAWSAVIEPMSILSRCWEGSFWLDWDRRDTLFTNIQNAQDLLVDVEQVDLTNVLYELRDLLVANLFILRDALLILGADCGPTVEEIRPTMLH